MDWFAQMMMFFQEWWPVLVLLFFVAAGMAADLFPKMAAFMHEVEHRYPMAIERLNKREQYVIDCYDRLPARIRAGFSLIGGKQAWEHLINVCYAFIRKKQHRE